MCHLSDVTATQNTESRKTKDKIEMEQEEGEWDNFMSYSNIATVIEENQGNVQTQNKFPE